jgi:large conductance mechanosensitive channel
MKKFFNEFKKFISRGNVIDLAVGVIIGSAFTAIVNALVDSVISPVISAATGGIDFDELVIPFFGTQGIRIGAFINAVIQFVIIALVVFLMVRVINGLRRKHEEPAPAPKHICPHCRLEVNEHATRCPHCTSDMTPVSDAQ